MKVVLLAGGFGTRISEESQFKPKPMIEIGGKPILWHIMKEYEYLKRLGKCISNGSVRGEILDEYKADPRRAVRLPPPAAAQRE